jgi:hypothetical protein
MTNLTCTLCVYKNKHRHLLSQNAFEMLVPFFVWSFLQRVEYTCPFIQRIDYEYNPVAHDAPAAPLFKQYRFKVFKYEKYWCQ